MNLRHAAAALPMPVGQYLILVAAPIVGVATAAMLVVVTLLPHLFVGSFAALVFAIPVFALIAVAVYPFVLAERKRVGINNNIHLFITHLGVLATANIPRTDTFRILAKKKEYGALAEEAHRIYELVARWNMGLAEACRFTAQRTPSRIFRDFLERFAYSLDAGEDFETFLRHEQTTVMEEYSTLYRGRLYELENLKSLFVSLVMAMVFMVIFLLILPILTGSNAGLLMSGALIAVAFLEVTFVHLAKAKAPADPLWFEDVSETRIRRLVAITLPISLVGCLVVAWATLTFLDLPVSLTLAAGLTPLALTGFFVSREENRVRRRDDNFAAFIRSLGASASSRGGAVRDVLKNLRAHDFGPLSDDIRALHQRLNVQVDDRKAWRFFAADTGSNLIDKFSAMFVEGVKAGGKPDAIGLILSENFVRILGLRKHRFQIAASLRGLFYGLAAGVAFAFFVGLGVIRMITGVFESIELPEGATFIADFGRTAMPFELLTVLIALALLLHAGACALMVRVATGGNFFGSWVDFVGLSWVSALVGVFSLWAIDNLVGAASGI